MKFLILRFSSIGDIVLTTPVMRRIKKALPQAEVHYATKARFAQVLEANPYIDKLLLLNDNLGELITCLKAEQYTCIIDLHHNLRTLRIKMALGVKSYSFNKLNFEKWLYVNLKINRLPAKHIVDRYTDTLKAFNIPDDGNGLDYFIPRDEEISMLTLPETHRNGYAVVVIGAQHFTKRLPVPRLIELCLMIQQPIILAGGSEDKKRGEEITYATELLEPGKVFNACGNYNLHGSASVVRQAQVVFSHDTGLMHIAAAFKKEIYAVWGNTTPFFGMYPYRTKHHNWENNNLSCRPCSKIGYAACPKGHFNCMNLLEFNIPPQQPL